MYGDMETKNNFIDHPLNVWDLAVTFCPEVDELRYIHMEEMMLNNVAGARQVYERWMTGTPDQQSWLSYIEFELRDLQCHPKVSSWIGFVKFELKNGEARNCYERAVDKLRDDDDEVEQLFLSFAEFKDKLEKKLYIHEIT
ncbi:hypothetical protein R3W88_027141 [Solanum pinnatisectum]|uniref:Uncharacterized protein n=1 Tax=Solanum pinnatisectum TaxID=50273 RepID=A0AAV9LIZ5_9SOLN|nr:hypothetical protein R3W88_027141 [Solanum pinnatisectum]